MALCNLKAEMRRVGLTQYQVAERLGMSEKNFSLKANERIPTTVDEAREIKREFFPSLSLDYLFASDGNPAD